MTCHISAQIENVVIELCEGRNRLWDIWLWNYIAVSHNSPSRVFLSGCAKEERRSEETGVKIEDAERKCMYL